jgi:hypothetical protein
MGVEMDSGIIAYDKTMPASNYSPNLAALDLVSQDQQVVFETSHHEQKGKAIVELDCVSKNNDSGV